MTLHDYNRCVDEHADPLYRFLLRGAGCGEKAKDLVQEAFEKLWMHRREVEPAKAKAYLFRVAYNAMIDAMRRDKRLSGLAEAAPAHHSHQYTDLNEALHRAVELLPADQRAVVLLRDYEGYSYEEIGAITGLNPPQVKAYIYRARLFLRERLGSIDRIV